MSGAAVDSGIDPAACPRCFSTLDSGLLVGEGQTLTKYERDALWRLFVYIGRCWKNVSKDSIGLKSSWLEFITAKTEIAPSYTAEYSNAVLVIDELIAHYGEADAFDRLFFQNGIPSPAPPPRTALAHAKQYVVDEFIRVQIVASGFRGYGGGQKGKNYNGFVRGSRYNWTERTRSFKPPKKESS
jgi:hypothetical protein